MDSMEIIKVIAVHGLSVNSPWTMKTEFGCVYCQNRIRGIHGMSVESMESTWITWGSDKSSSSPINDGQFLINKMIRLLNKL
jgi:hypothetical protein